MSKTREFTLTFSRLELEWLYRNMKHAHDKMEKIIATFSGPVAELTEPQALELKEAQTYVTELRDLARSMDATLTAGDQNRLKLRDTKAALEEAFDLVEEDSAKALILEKMRELPKDEVYRVTLDRGSAKFTLKLIESDLEKVRNKMIPTYEKKDDSEFTDPIMTRTYYLNKAKRIKRTLEELQGKLQKAL